MTIKLPETINQLYFCGDIHGNFEYIKYFLNQFHISNSCIIICGDVGMGFQPKQDKHIIKYIDNKLKEKNNFVVGIRGNHDDPNFFQATTLGNCNWINVLDYTVVNVCNKNILCIGGGISIDRMLREINASYWDNEIIKYQPKVSEKIDIIASHESPNIAFPHTLSKVVMDFAKYDKQLLDDVKSSRETLDKVLDDYKNDITHWFYGHYHNSCLEENMGINFRLLNIGELDLYKD